MFILTDSDGVLVAIGNEVVESNEEQGTLQGFPDGTFKPAEPMTREQYTQAEYNKAKREGRI